MTPKQPQKDVMPDEIFVHCIERNPDCASNIYASENRKRGLKNEKYIRAALMPANWMKDSSLKTWFPFAAEERHKLREENARLRADLSKPAIQPDAAKKALDEIPAAGMGMGVLRELAVWYNTHQVIIRTLLEHAAKGGG